MFRSMPLLILKSHNHRIQHEPTNVYICTFDLVNSIIISNIDAAYSVTEYNKRMPIKLKFFQPHVESK